MKTLCKTFVKELARLDASATMIETAIEKLKGRPAAKAEVEFVTGKIEAMREVVRAQLRNPNDRILYADDGSLTAAGVRLAGSVGLAAQAVLGQLG